ncbi:MAG TPA: peptide-methionine (R)-S-oxide reductase MsrB [Burkholderiales bacterium]|nr:peptide-methionine (R)-S-oxide reductase MsrB [Burkholderiales bacterium]
MSEAKKVVKSDDEWRAQLSPTEYEITRQAGTERAFTGRFWNHFEDGVYRCVCCGEPLFKSETKYDHGCGWPSYSAPISKEAIEALPDYSHFMERTEVRCSKCGAHLGHMFDDGPQPTSERYCINSASLKFDKK